MNLFRHFLKNFIFSFYLSGIFCIAGAGIALALDPDKPVHQFHQTTWTSNEGLPQNSIYAMVQTGDHYIWLGTQEGLIRFDGVRFEIFDTKNTPAIRHNWIMCLYEDREETLWIGTNGGGLTAYRKGVWTNYSTRDGLSNDFIWSVTQDRDGAIWTATNRGLNKLKDGQIHIYTTQNGLCSDMTRSVIEDRQGVIWIGAYGGLSKFHKGTFENYSVSNGLSNNAVSVCYEDTKGIIWAGTYGGGLNRFENGRWSSLSVKDGLASDMVATLFEDRQGSLWIGTRGGVSRYVNGEFSTYSVKQGLSNNHIRKFLEDHEGNLWIGTDGGGLNRLRDSKCVTYSTRHGLSYNIVRCVYEDRVGTIWIGTSGGGLNRLKDGIFRAYTTKDGLSSDIVWSVCQDRKGCLWAGTDGNGLNVLNNGRFRSYHVKDGLSNEFIRAMCVDNNDDLWIATLNGLNCFKNGKFTIYNTNNGLSNNTILSVTVDREGTVWAGTNGGGLNYFKNGKWSVYNTRDGLSNDIVLCAYIDNENALWVGTDGGGLNRLKNGKWTHYTTDHGLHDNLIFSILEDNKGSLWMSCNRGIFEVSKKDLDDFSVGKIRRIKSAVYTNADGMMSPECCGRNQPSGWKTSDGKLLYPTVMGMVIVNPENLKNNVLPPPIHIEKIIADDSTAGWDKLSDSLPVIFGPGAEKLEIHFTALSFVIPEKARFMYKLEGFDRNWVDAGSRRIAYYTNLPPGEYGFKVKACNNDGVWNETGASRIIILRPFVYQTKWFYGLCVIAFILGVYMVYRFRIHQVEKRKTELEIMVNEKTATIGAQKKDLEIALAELKNTQIQLVQSAKMSSLGQLVAGLAHEINNPITFIYSNLTYLEHHIRQMEQLIRTADDFLDGNKRMEFETAKKQAEYEYITSDLTHLLQSYKKGAKRIREIVINLRTFSRLDETEWQTVNIHDNLDATVSLVSKQYEHRITIIKDYGNLPDIECSCGQMNQAFMHLIKNAIQSIPETGEIRLTTRRINEHISISFRDSGVGMDESLKQRIFEPFFTTRDIGQGVGLGLSISYGIVQEHNGKIDVISAPGQGSEFIITLPLRLKK